MIKFLIEKEFKQLLRNSFLPKLILVFPCMIMLLMPWAVNLEIKNIQLNIVDNDHSAISQRLVNKIAASTYFRLVEVPASYEEGLRNIETGTADIVMEIPGHLERDWMNGEDAHILIAANAVNGTKGGLGSSYLASIVNDYAAELRSERPEAAAVSGACTGERKRRADQSCISSMGWPQYQQAGTVAVWTDDVRGTVSGLRFAALRRGKCFRCGLHPEISGVAFCKEQSPHLPEKYAADRKRG